MLRSATAAFGLDYARFVKLGRLGQLVEPELRDLWLIWGDIAAPRTPEDRLPVDA